MSGNSTATGWRHSPSNESGARSFAWPEEDVLDAARACFSPSVSGGDPHNKRAPVQLDRGSLVE